MTIGKSGGMQSRRDAGANLSWWLLWSDTQNKFHRGR